VRKGGRVWRTYDLLDDLGGGVQVDETLVDPHLESVPSLGTLTTGTALREQEPIIDGMVSGCRETK
jgi:hypothetical protein